MELPEIVIGRKSIMAALQMLDWGTVRNWKRKYALPIRYLPNGKPFVVLSEVREWMVVFSDLKRKTHPFSTPFPSRQIGGNMKHYSHD